MWGNHMHVETDICVGRERSRERKDRNMVQVRAASLTTVKPRHIRRCHKRQRRKTSASFWRLHDIGRSIDIVIPNIPNGVSSHTKQTQTKQLNSSKTIKLFLKYTFKSSKSRAVSWFIMVHLLRVSSPFSNQTIPITNHQSLITNR
ncbi:uncharacterized protein YALI1_C20554g [Yarrowia lipolytica]|uniref:Uncharacterized protein n=1 Tax=Yarrowia lipolytica TaxID=4952 RepID=A0A1D8NB74_YARLL|nr:hypothetical protein YALI1_C20554g [Yarrowia lipolytica]